MSAVPQPSRYAPVQIAVHWLVVLLFAFNFIVSEDMGRALRVKLEGGVPDQLVALVHPPVGVAVLVLTLVRLVLRWRMGAPGAVPGSTRVMAAAAHWGHVALYAVLLAIPLSGMAAWGAGIAVMGEVHEVVVKLALLLVLGHAASALYHQFVLKDGTLNRMRLMRK